jgi:cytochrome c553
LLRRNGRWALGLAALFISGAVLAQKPAAKPAAAPPPPERLAACAACHGADGNSAVAGVPSLAGQPKIFLENYLVLVREGLRGNDVMRELLKGTKDADLVALANYYTALPPKPASQAKPDPALYRRGQQLARAKLCTTCHLSGFQGREQMPRLAGQREDFLYEIMVAYQNNKRAGGDTMMSAALYGIPDADIKALAHYLAHHK